MPSSFEITIYQGGTLDYDFPLLDANDDAVAIQATDVLRFKVGRGDGVEPVLDLLSGDGKETENGSSVTLTTSPASARVRLAQGDTALLNPGIYRAELGLVDDSETDPADAYKPVSQGVVHVIGRMGGEIDKGGS